MKTLLFMIAILGLRPTASADTWVCTIKAMGDSYTGTGPTKALANVKALEACKNAHQGNGFFCKEATCEQ